MKATAGWIRDAGSAGDTRELTEVVDWRLSPARFLVCLGLALAAIILLDCQMTLGEQEGVALSIAVAFVLWVISARVLRVQQFGATFLRLLNVLLAAKVLAGLAHFYFLFAPAAGIPDAASTRSADFGGDLTAIHGSAVTFAAYREMNGLWSALNDDYYRGINNPGIAAIYGLLYGSFGPYPPVAVPWNALAMGWASLLVGAIGRLLGVPQNARRLAMLLTLLMPSFFIGCPLYRDQFMIFLILLITYGCMFALSADFWPSVATAIVGAWFLSSLRGVYLAVPLLVAAGLAFGLRRVHAQLRTWVALIVVLFVIGVGAMWLDLMPRREMWPSEATAGFAGQVFGAGPIGRALYLLLTPMPWYQDGPAALLVYQVFDYAQTFLSLTVLAALVVAPAGTWMKSNTQSLLLIGLFLFAAAMVGSGLAQRYAQIALPLFILGTATVVVRQWRQCMLVSASVILLAHVALALRSL